MKRILILTMIELSFLTGCDKLRQFREVEESFVVIDLHGEEFCSEVMTNKEYRIMSENELLECNNEGFTLIYKHELSSESENVNLYIRLCGNAPYETGVRYHFPSDSTSVADYSTARISLTDDDRIQHYYALDGWVVLDAVNEVYAESDKEKRLKFYRVDGRFGFTAVEEHSGKIIEITDGAFCNTMFLPKTGMTSVAK